ncbi:MAG: PRC-barrel domain-containing protein [Sphingomicrobium sp.]
MRPGDPIKLVSELLDLPLIDRDGSYCGIVDDVEFSGASGKPLKVMALLVGPGAYAGRMPRWMMAAVRAVAGDHAARVPFDAIETIGAAVRLKRTAEQLGLGKGDDRTARWIPRKGAL